MRADLKYIICRSTLPVDLSEWMPTTKEFGIEVALFIGTEDAPESDCFDLYLCTPGFFAERMAEGQVESGQYVIFVKEFSYSAFRKYVEAYVRTCDGDSWPEIAVKLSHLGLWEHNTFNTQISARNIGNAIRGF